MRAIHFRHRWASALAVLLILLCCLYLYGFPTEGEHPETAGTINSLDNGGSETAPQPPASPSPSPHPDNIGLSRNFTRSLIIARLSSENTDWAVHGLAQEQLLDHFVYTVDNPDAENAVPANKGHEAMVYLTHIIDHYDNLSDVNMFMHSHLEAWHNNDLLRSSSAVMIKRLNNAKVVREGYVNMRCHLDPGCPRHILLNSGRNKDIPEAVIMAQAWTELFPDEPVPEVVSQPCCSQFALSRDRIRTLPKERYLAFRQWLLDSSLDDKLSGRVFEYVWQYLWAGVYEFCPKEHVCYCDTYGVCFGGEDEYSLYFELRDEARDLRSEISKLIWGPARTRDHARASELREQAQEIEHRHMHMKKEALENGKSSRKRAAELGRPWREGDGF